MSQRKTRILFLCTGNSCRSQMAEGWGRHLGQDIAEFESAGIEAHGKNPRAIAVMHEAGVDISGQESTRVSDAMIRQADIVVTVCGHADDHCPMLPPGVKRIHWPLTDPDKATGDIQGRMSAAGDRMSDAAIEDEILDQFRATRDEVRRRVADLIQSLGAQARSA